MNSILKREYTSTYKGWKIYREWREIMSPENELQGISPSDYRVKPIRPKPKTTYSYGGLRSIREARAWIDRYGDEYSL